MAEHETIADIIAEMRRGTRLPGYWRSCDVNKILQYHADRLEAAHKRELSKDVSKNGADFGQLGDAAKLREALVRVLDWLKRMNAQPLNTLAVSELTPSYAVNRTAKSIIEDNDYHISQLTAALSAPPRNCDVGTAKEQDERFHRFCKCHRTGSCAGCHNPVGDYTVANGVRECALVWAQMSYEEGGAK